MKGILFAVAAGSILLASADCWGRDFPAPRMGDNSEAPQICPSVCIEHGRRWNGNHVCVFRLISRRTECVCGCTGN